MTVHELICLEEQGMELTEAESKIVSDYYNSK